mgnify:CR=1 FL=1
MVHTSFESYCESCEELEPQALINISGNLDSGRTVETTICCKHRHRCAAIRKSIQEDMMR